MAKYTLLKNKEGDRSVRINKTGEIVSEKYDASLYAELRKKALTNLRSAQFREMCSDLGIHRVIGSVSGKVYYE
jgi:hypothetical protein